MARIAVRNNWAGLTRRHFCKTLALGAAAGMGVSFPGILSAQGRYAGETINVTMFSHAFVRLLRDLLPEFEAESGITVNLTDKAFPIYNQQTDLELATGGSAFDVISISMIYTARWIGAGWMEPLDPFLQDANVTPPDWDAPDFLDALQRFGRSADGSTTYGIPWEAGVWLLAAGRGDLMDKAGLANGGIPQTFAEMADNCARLKAVDASVSPFVAENTHHANYPMYLMGMGGSVFKDAPDNLTPVLDTQVAGEAAELYGSLLRDFGPEGVLSFNQDQAAVALSEGRANYWHWTLPWIVDATAGDSAIKDTVRFGEVPAGPVGAFPGVVTHSLGIPKFSSKKGAAWEFIRWSMSPEIQRRLAIGSGYAATTRASILRDPEFVEKFTINGTNVPALVETILGKAAGKDYMNYRIVSPFPIVGQHINSAIQKVASGQATGAEAMEVAQKDILVDFRKSQIEIDP